MKANELRLGNWWDNKEGREFIIDNETMINFMNEALENNGEVSIDPVPLTERWFKYFNIKQRTVVGETKERMFIDNIEIPEWIKYVHDLQNWYYYKFEKKGLI